MDTPTTTNIKTPEVNHELMTEQIVEHYAQSAEQTENTRSGHMGRALAAGVGLAAVATALSMPSPQQTEASPVNKSSSEQYQSAPTVFAKFKSESSRSKVKVSDLAEGKVTILANVSTKMSAKQQRRLEKQGRCRTFNGKRVDIKTYGYGVDGGQYGRDYRTSRFCKVNGNWIRVRCKNPAIIERQAPPARNPNNKFIFVNKGFAKANLNLSATATATAYCQEGGAGASASATASASSKGSLRWLVKTNGRKYGSGRVKTVSRLEGRATGRASAKASAKVECSSQEVVIVKQPPPPEQPQNNPPAVDLIGPQHVKTGGIYDFCSYESDPNNDIVGRSYSETGRGNFISNIYRGDEPGEYCITYKAGTEAENATVSVKVTDSANNMASDSETFPVDDSSKGEF